MVIVCNGTCHKYSEGSTKGGRYNTGQKRCPYCSVFIKWEGLRCPCCSGKLRTTPRGNKKDRNRVQDQMGVKRY